MIGLLRRRWRSFFAPPALPEQVWRVEGIGLVVVMDPHFSGSRHIFVRVHRLGDEDDTISIRDSDFYGCSTLAKNVGLNELPVHD